MNFKEKYKNEMDALPFSSDYEIRLTDALKNTAPLKKTAFIRPKKKIIRLLAAIISIIVILSVSTVAEPSMSPPEELDEVFQKSTSGWENRWKRRRTFPMTFSCEDVAYEDISPTILGIASGKFLNEYEGFSADEAKDYFVVALYDREGYLTLENDLGIKISPFIFGREPWEVNSSTLCTDMRVTAKNGVIYYLFDTGFLERFKGKTIYFAAYEGDSPTEEIFTVKKNGEIAFNESFKGFHAIHYLPLDLTDTHPEIAEEMLLKDDLAKLVHGKRPSD